MNPSTLAGLILGQVILFQFVSISLTRSLFTVRLGELTGPTADEADAYLHRSARIRFGLGVLLGSLALASFVSVPADPGARKLLLAAVSLSSSAAFAATFVRDWRTARAVADALPDAGRRRASLQPRSATKGYHPAWEFLPILILGATVTLTLVLGRRIGHVPAEMWVLAAVQTVAATAGLVYTLRYGIGVPTVSSRLAAFRDHEELDLEFGERLGIQERRYFMLAKIGVALILGLASARVGYSALDHEVAALLGTLRWGVVGALVVTFATYVMGVAALVRHVRRRSQPNLSKGHDRG